MSQPLPQPEFIQAPPGRWWREWEVLLVGLLVVAIYLPRLTVAPVCGEESRWATAAREMIAGGDWIVPRQQGAIFPERPPLGSWAMALVGLIRGEVDLVAIRLPSVIATVLTSLLIYGYSRLGMSRAASVCAAVIYATFGQVMALGRFGESEALFTLFVAGSLLVWHAGYLRHWPAAITWSLGYTLAALGALVKGPQAPVYFVSVCGVYLLLKRDWRYLLGRGQLAGAACFALVVGAWMIPFAWSHGESLSAIWTGLARERFTTAGLARHLASYPFETLGCLLPWSGLLFALFNPRVRKAIFSERPQSQFLVTALAVTYPSVWLAAGARGRYFMPLYPCVAVLIGYVVEQCASRAATRAQRLFWRHYMRGLAVAVVLGAAGLVVINFLPDARFADARQGGAFLCLLVVAAIAVAGVLAWTTGCEDASRPQIAVLALASFLAVAYTGAMLNSRVQGANDLMPIAAQIRAQVGDSPGLVSLNSVYHRFAYCYGAPIRQISWPQAAGDVPAEVTYFCFDLLPGYFDPADSASPTPRPDATAPLPFEWEKVTEIACDPVRRAQAHRRVVIGRIRRPAVLAEPAARRAERR